MLLALAASTAILIVEFGMERRAMGEAAIGGAKARFRAVMMTRFAFIAGLYPLVVAEGASTLARQGVGMPTLYVVTPEPRPWAPGEDPRA